MDKVVKEVFRATELSLKQEKITFEITDQKRFFQVARENGLSGILYSQLDKNNINPEVYTLFHKDFLAYTHSDILQEHVVKELTNLFNEAGIDHIFLKGVVLKKLYPEPYMRSMGDIDLVVKEAHHPKAKKLMKEANYELISDSQQHTNFKHLSGVHLELHPRLSYVFNEKHAKFLESVWVYAVQSELHRYQFKPEFELVYLLYHMAKHFYGTGVGIRSVLDIGIYAKHYEASFNLEELDKILEKSNLTTFLGTMLLLNRMYFNLDVLSKYVKNISLSNQTFEKVTQLIVSSGVHGHGKDFNPFLGRLGGSKVKGQKKLVFILALTFPSYRSMKGMYPWLRYVPFMYPFTWVIRWMKLVFKKTRRTLGKIKQLFVSNEAGAEIANLYKDIGL